MKVVSQNSGGALQDHGLKSEIEEQRESAGRDGSGIAAVEFSATIRTEELGEILHVHAHYHEHPEALESFEALDQLVWEIRRFQDNC